MPNVIILVFFLYLHVLHYRITRQEVGHDISDMLISCAFNGNKCYKENFTLFQSLEYGNCYTFQDTSYVTKQSGPLLGLRLVLNIETKEYIQNYMDATGLRLVIHEPGTLPFPEEEGFTLNPNYETTIGMRMLTIHRASEPHGSCESGKEFFDLFGIKYTIPACLKLCQIREIIERCHCKPSTSSLDLGIDDLNVFDSCMDRDATLHCEDYVIYKIENQHISCNCRSPCNQIVYKTSLSGRTWPNHEYLVGNILPEICGVDSKQWYFESLCNVTTGLTPTNLTGIQENFLKALIYYEDLNYEKITEEPLYDGFQLISDIGGALGLFMGASILSFVEVLQFMIELLNFLRHKIVSRRSKKTKVINLKDNNLFNVGTKA
ncbi:FMRFamide-activated amiloride-sensitive sodium channel-like [Crassostrea virginica]